MKSSFRLDRLPDRVFQKTSLPEKTPDTDMVVASMDVNGEIRAAAVQSMLRTLRESAGLDSETLVSTLSPLLHMP
jgi:hypothetical protein